MDHQHTQLHKSALSVQACLLNKGFRFDVQELAASTRTALDAANALGCEIAQIVKSLVFCTKFSKQSILILASGINRVNEAKVETILGEKIQKADADYVRDMTGFAIGGVPPVGHKSEMDHIFIDEDLFAFDVLWAAAGTPNAVFQCESKDLLKMTDGKIVAIKDR